MSVLKRVVDGGGQPIGWRHDCPGCGGPHVIHVDQANRSGARWTFDGSETAPTFSPSINARWGHHAAGESEADCLTCRAARARGRASACGICHYFIRAGRIEFCADSTHALAGQAVDLPEIAP